MEHELSCWVPFAEVLRAMANILKNFNCQVCAVCTNALCSCYAMCCHQARLCVASTEGSLCPLSRVSYLHAHL